MLNAIEISLYVAHNKMLVGQHQLECAQLSIRVRELTQQVSQSEEKEGALSARLAELQREREGKEMALAQLEEMRESEGRARTQLAELETLSKKQGRELAALSKECVQSEKK